MKKIKVVLLEDIKGKGKKGDVVEVADGYANFLLSNKKAKEATKAALQELKDKENSRQRDLELKRIEAIKLKEIIDGKSVDFHVEAGPTGVLHESINSSRIGNMIATQYGVEVDRRKINLLGDENMIKTFGAFNASVQLFPDVVANIIVNVSE